MVENNTSYNSNINNVKKIRHICIDHSKDLLNSAIVLKEKGYHNIAFHLALLSLEEIGKAIMLVIGYTNFKGEDNFIYQANEDHKKKLFWALWSPTMEKDKITRKQIESYKDLAYNLHQKRLSGLYVYVNIENIEHPNKTVCEKELETLIRITESRIGMEEHSEIKEFETQQIKDMEWFQEASDKTENKNLIFGNKSLDKLHEIGDIKAWIRWLKEQFEIAEKESKELTAKEMKRIEPVGEERKHSKWEVKYRLLTLSHSIRQNVLNKWNSNSKYIKLNLGKEDKRKREIIVDLMLPKSVSANALWWTGWGYARRVAVALNIGTQGYFWWQIPKDISRFYDKIKDLDSNCEVVVERIPKLSLDWGNLILTERNLWDMGLALSFMPHPGEKSKNEPFDHYIAGISMLAKNDIHVQCEPDVFQHFFNALRSAMIIYGDYKKDNEFRVKAAEVFENIAPGLEFYKDYINIAESYEETGKWNQVLTLTEAVGMKLLCDIYLLAKFRKLATERVNKNKGPIQV